MRYLFSGTIVQESLCCIELKKSTTEKDIFEVLNEFFLRGGFSWSKCTARHVKVLIRLIRQVRSNILFTHCMIHREALASKELSSELMVVTNHIVNIFNFIKSKPQSHCLSTVP